MRETAEVIQTNAHLAMTELREVLGILRAPEGGDGTLVRPQPSVRDIVTVVAEARAAGLKVELEDHLAGQDGLSEVTGRTAFRVVQEGLTNVRKHAQSTRVVLRLSGSPQTGMTVELRNPLQVGERQHLGPTSGLGLVGLAERVSLAGGRLSHEVTAEHVFVLRAWLPWQA
jgi:signal transduction histidine kinase